MTFSIRCPQCSVKLTAKDSLVGRTIPCPKCGHKVVVQAPQSSSPLNQPKDSILGGGLDDGSELKLAPLESSAAPQRDLHPPGLPVQRRLPEAASVKPAEIKYSSTLIAVIAIVGGIVAVSFSVGLLLLVGLMLRGNGPAVAVAPAEKSPAAPENASPTTAAPSSVSSEGPLPVQNAVSSAQGDPAPLFPVAASKTSRSKAPSASPLTTGGAGENSPASNLPKAAIQPASTPESAPDTLERLKDATVFISVSTRGGKQSGSGFLLEKDGNRGVVVTNAHVVTPERGSLRQIECVFHSGTRKEFALRANISGKDDAADLAVLTVEHSNLPEPLNATKEVALRETLPVLALGFPFGEVLATSGSRPSISVSKAAISSIRRDEFDNVVLLQIDGGVNPGNSGGPLVTEDGNLVGIAMAKVRNADIGFAIPRHVLSDLLLGRVAGVGIRELNRSSESTHYRVNAELIDPKQNVVSVEILAFEEARATVKKPCSDGRWQRVSDDFIEQKLKMSDLTAVADIAVPSGGKQWQFQIRWEGKDGRERFTQPAPFVATTVAPPSRIASTTAPGDSGTPPPGDSIAPAEDQAGVQVIKLPAPYTEVDIAAAGKYLVLNLPSIRKLAVLDFAERKVVKYLDVAGQGICTAGAQKLVFVLPSQGIIQRWNLDTFQRELVVPLELQYTPSIAVMGSASDGPILIGGGTHGGGGFKLLDLATLKSIDFMSILEGNPPGLFEAYDNYRVRASANGRLFTSWCTHLSPTGLNVLSIDGTQMRSNHEHTSVGYIAPSADGSVLYTARGIYTANLKLIGANENLFATSFPVPAVQGNFYLRIERTSVNHLADKKFPSVSIHAAGFDGPIIMLPQVTMQGGNYGDFFSRDEIPLDQRILFVPEAKIIATLPVTDDVVVLREFDVLKELNDSGKDYLFVHSSPPRRATVGVPLEYQLNVASKLGDVVYKVEGGPKALKISKEGKLTWTPAASDSSPQSVIIVVSDASGREVFHTFQVEVVSNRPLGKSKAK